MRTPKIRHNSKSTHLKTVVRETKAALDAVKAAEDKVEKQQAVINRLVQLVQQANDQRDGALAAHQSVVQYLMRSTAEDAAQYQALALARPKLPVDTDTDVLKVIDDAMTGRMGAFYHGALVRAQEFETVAHEAAAVLREAEHELTVHHGLKAVDDANGPGEPIALDFDQALKRIGGAVGRYDAIVNPPKAEEPAKLVDTEARPLTPESPVEAAAQMVEAAQPITPDVEIVSPEEFAGRTKVSS